MLEAIAMTRGRKIFNLDHDASCQTKCNRASHVDVSILCKLALWLMASVASVIHSWYWVHSWFCRNSHGTLAFLSFQHACHSWAIQHEACASQSTDNVTPFACNASTLFGMKFWMLKRLLYCITSWSIECMSWKYFKLLFLPKRNFCCCHATHERTTTAW